MNYLDFIIGYNEREAIDWQLPRAVWQVVSANVTREPKPRWSADDVRSRLNLEHLVDITEWKEGMAGCLINLRIFQFLI